MNLPSLSPLTWVLLAVVGLLVAAFIYGRLRKRGPDLVAPPFLPQQLEERVASGVPAYPASAAGF